MKPDYKNWVPKGMIASFAAGAGIALVLFLIFGVCGAFVGGVLRWFLAGLFGAVIPITLKKLNIDPAVGSSVLLTTVTDIVGFFSFLGLATWILL